MTIATASAPVRTPVRRNRRLVIGIALAIVCIGSVVYRPAFTIVVAAIAVGSLREFSRLSQRNGSSLEYPVALTATLAYLALTHFGLIHRYEGVLLAATLLAALVTATLRARDGYFVRSAYTVLAVLYIGKLESYFITIRAVPQLGPALTVYAIVLVAMTDIWAMVVGVAFGRTPLSPISPRKTVEGAVGGLIGSVVVGIAMGMTPAIGLRWWEGALVGAITSVAAQFGDLVESALKREARVKDTGRAIGSHGGVLDRFDSYLFGGIAFYFALFLIGIVPVR